MKKYIGQHIFDYVASFRQNVGVGTDTPSEKLHVVGNFNLDGNADISGQLVLPQTSTTIGTANLANASLLVGSTSSGIGIDNNEIVQTGNNLNISVITTGDIKFRTAATLRAIINSSGNVGIGTDSPSVKLDVVDTSSNIQLALKGATDANSGIRFTDGVDSDSNFSGKFGGSVAATDKLGIYGEVAFSNVFDEDTDNTWGTKLGAKYSF